MRMFLIAALLLVPPAFVCVSSAAAQSSYDLRSPDNRIEIRVRTAARLRYDVVLEGRALLQDCTLRLDVEHKTLGVAPKVTDAKQRTNDQLVEPVVRRQFAKVRHHYDERRVR